MSEQANAENAYAEDMIKIMVASDIHLGYCEKDAIRGEDSFIAFEEVLQLAQKHNVDFILLGGDLFHDATPSQNALHKCFKLLRQYTLGDRPISLELLSDQSVNFSESLNQTVNYEDPNLNISIPVFSIHGNHDDPSGFGRLSSLDILSTSGLVNYFGKCVDLTKININPILFKKGETQLALYGLSHIHDARLVRLFRDSKVIMQKPDEKTGEWFNILVLHQNRADRGPKNYVPEIILPEFLDVVIWGHEHDCRIIPELSKDGNFHVTQPGSTVATSLAEGESLEKHCGLLFVRQGQFKVEPIKLATVRPFIFDTLCLPDELQKYMFEIGDIHEKAMNIAKEKVEEMISKAKEKLTGHPKQPTLPLIRLKLTYSHEEQMFNAIRFGQGYSGKVANPMDMILFKRIVQRTKIDGKGFDKTAMEDAFDQEKISHEARVEQVVERYFEEVDDSKKLQIMSSKVLSEMCRRLVERSDYNASENIVKFYKEKANLFLMASLPGEDEINGEIDKFKRKENEIYDAVLKMLDERGEKNPSVDLENDELVNIDTYEKKPAKRATKTSKAATEPKETTRGRGRGRGKGRGRGVQRTELDISVGKTSTLRSLTETFSQATTTRQKRNQPTITYEISDSD